MRFNTTTEHSQKRDAWKQAYAAYDAFAEAGDDGIRFGGTAEADAASDAEHHTLHAFLTHPATTPAELQDKIATMRQRGPLDLENLNWNAPDITAYLDGIERDLMVMTRPAVSTELAAAFARWSEAHAVFWSRKGWSDEEIARLCDIEDQAEKALHAVPCTTPGDFIAKGYVDLMSEYGAQGTGPDGLAFLIDESKINHAADKARLRDIMDSDLGCCMAALGRTDFEAREWIVQAQRFEKHVAVQLIGTGSGTKRSLSIGMDGTHSEMEYILQRLTANGLRMVSVERCCAIATEIEDNWPRLVVDYRALEPA